MKRSFPFRLSSLEDEGMMNCSRWLRHAVLLDLSELKDLLKSLGECFFLPGTGLVSEDNWSVSKENILENYREYLSWINSKEIMPSPELKRFFTLMLSPGVEEFYAVKAGGRYLLKAKLPVIQVQLYHCFISRFDKQIHPMALSKDSFSFGLQFSYPQVYEDPKTHLFSKVLLEKQFASSALFKKLVQWVRKNTKPVLLTIQESQVNAPFRMGKKSQDLVDAHLGLKKALDYVCT
jgi:hypothetical protein